MLNTTQQEGEFDEILSYNPGNITFTIRNSIVRKDKIGNEVIEWSTHICKAYGHLAEEAKMGKRGDLISIRGSYIDSQYKRKEGTKSGSEKHILCRSVFIKK